jgi:putative nucleotidyltransferase with HDIG domain
LLKLLPGPLTKLVNRFVELLPVGTPLYLVGGAVRDLLLGREVHDLDLALPGNVLNTARSLADAVGGAYYALDTERDTARIVLMPEGQSRLIVDVAALRGGSIEPDLRQRDFTVNAIAVDLRHPDTLVDPLNGAADLQARRLRVCSEQSLLDDPVRVWRAVRVAFSHQLKITSETRQLIRQAVPRLSEVSIERLRDELFRILSGSFASQAVRTLDLFGAVDSVLPELGDLKNITQSPPHVLDVWEHTLAVVDRLQTILSVLNPVYDTDQAGNLSIGLAVLRLGRYRNQISEHLETCLTPERTVKSLLVMAALYHDIAKPHTRQVDAGGRYRFFEHDRIGAEIAAERGRLLRLSVDESERLKNIVRHHMRPMLLAQDSGLPSPRAIHRFYRDSGSVGVDVCLLSLADFMGAYGPELPPDAWSHHLDIVRELLESWWERNEKVVNPPRLLDGHQIIQRFGLNPGPRIGELLEAVQEAQASGEVKTQEDAIRWVEKRISGE